MHTLACDGTKTAPRLAEVQEWASGIFAAGKARKVARRQAEAAAVPCLNPASQAITLEMRYFDHPHPQLPDVKKQVMAEGGHYRDRLSCRILYRGGGGGLTPFEESLRASLGDGFSLCSRPLGLCK